MLAAAALVADQSRAAAAPAAGGPAGASIEALLRTGQYERARKAAEALARKKGSGARAAVLAARAEQQLGLLVEARQRLEQASISAPDDLPLRAELVRVVEALGDRGAVKDLVNRSYDDWEAGKVNKKSAPELLAMALAVRYDNNWEDANAAFRDAVKADPRPVEANLEWGELFLEKHAEDNALACFRDALKLDPQNPDAQVGTARVLLEQGYDGAAAEKALAAALAVNPRHARALALRAEIALDAEELDAVAGLVAEIRRINPRDANAAWLAASRALLLEDRAGYEAERDRRMETRAADGEFFARTAEALVRHRRYEEARQVAAEGVERDGTHARLLSSLGNTLLRLGEEEEGLNLLRRAWDRDPYDVRTFNLLNLFEKVIATRYVSFASRHLRFRIEPQARPVTEQVIAPFLEATYADYVTRYGFAPTGPVVLELYGAPEHYAVRTVGLPRLGVAGVCFGRVVTSQAPGNGAFNWGMVLAHELAHVFALQLSRSRVPRWFTEGLSELETARLREEWRRQADLELYVALRAGALPPLASMSQAFVRARDSEAAALAYMHAAAAVEFLQRRFGFAKIRTALEAWGRGKRDAEVLEQLSGMPAAALEKVFRDDLGERLALYRGQFLPAHAARFAPTRPAARAGSTGPASAATLAETGLGALAAGDLDGGRAALEKARARPGAGEEPQVTFLAAEVALATDHPAEARRALAALVERGLDGYDVELRLGLAAVRLKDQVAAEAHLRKAVAFAPKSVEARTLLAEHLGALGRAEERLALETDVLRLEPQSARLAKGVALGHGRAGRAGPAAEAAGMAIFIDPDDPELHAALGRALVAQGKPIEGVRALELALSFSPEDPRPLHRTLAELYEKLGDRKRAALHRALATGKPPPQAP
jgi:tetratricopeptide (TPR) repeat protein